MSFSQKVLSLVLLFFGFCSAKVGAIFLVEIINLAGAANGVRSAGLIIGFSAAGLVATLRVA